MWSQLLLHKATLGQRSWSSQGRKLPKITTENVNESLRTQNKLTFEGKP